MDKLKECLLTRHSAKWARKDNHHVEILLSSYGEEKKNLEGLLWGVKDREAQGPSPRKNPSSAMGRIPPRLSMAEDKGNGLSLREADRVTPWNRKSTKTEKDNGENGNV